MLRGMRERGFRVPPVVTGGTHPPLFHPYDGGMFVKNAPDMDVLDWIMAWGVVILVPVIGIALLVVGFKWFHSMLNRYFR